MNSVIACACGETSDHVADELCHPAEHPIERDRSPKVESDGYFFKDEKYWKVQKTRDGQRLYAKVLTLTGDERGWHQRWEYAPGQLQFLRESHRLTKDQASNFGKLYGICMICGRTLTDEDSIAAGIGPICAGKAFI